MRLIRLTNTTPYGNSKDRQIPIFEQHQTQPGIPLFQHVTHTKLKLWEKLAPRKKIYLDMRFWILLRNAIQKKQNGSISRLYSTLKKGVEEGKIICPLSEPIYMELLKQQDPDTRRQSAKLMDQLSLGVSIEHYFHRMKYEIADLITNFSGHQTNIVPNQQLIWTKISYVFGEAHPAKTPFDCKTELAIQKSFFDYIWNVSLFELINSSEFTKIPTRDRNQTAKRLNTDKFEYAHELASFAQAYKAEAWGMADVTAEYAIEAMKDAATLAGIRIDDVTRKQDKDSINYYRNLIAHVLEKNKARADLRTLHILSCLHASLRWNRDQQIDGNDLYDFDHAAAAVGYCDVFLTEKPLKTMLEQRHLNLQNDFHCTIFSDIDAATEHLNSTILA